MTTDLRPTPEQLSCIENFSTGDTLRINAYAGTGKTTSLTLLAKSCNRRGTYLAFNRSIADDFLLGIKPVEEIEKDRSSAEDKGMAYEAPDYSAELRLFYVASTRAEVTLEIPDGITAKLQGLEMEPDPLPAPGRSDSHATKYSRDE